MGSLNPFAADIRDDPYPVYAELRETDPVYWSEDLNLWLVSSYETVQHALRAPELSRATEGERRPGQHVGSMKLMNQRMLIYNDPPVHTRSRSLVNKAFTPSVVERMRAKIQSVTDTLLDAVEPDGGMDLVRSFSYPLPAIVIAEMLGAPSEDHDHFKAWSSALAATQDPFPPRDAVHHADAAIEEANAYLHNLCQQRRKDPADDLLSALIAAEDTGSSLVEDELIATCVLILSAGHETTMNLISNGLLALLLHAEQLDRLRSDPSLIPVAVEELLRYDAPVQMTGRVALSNFRIGSKEISAGQSVVPIIGAANRDPAQFADPDRFDVERQPNHHISFGYGPHFCLGAPLARAEGQIAFATLLRRYAGMRFGGPPPVRSSTNLLRGLSSFPVEFG
jgi:cytochrome P450